MEGIFEVTLDGRSVGTVTVKREGLYCRINCRCRAPMDQIHRLYAGGERIGVLIPESGELVLQTKVAAKRLKEGSGFTLGENQGKFIPIQPGEAFPYLEKVRWGRLAFREGTPGLLLREDG